MAGKKKFSYYNDYSTVNFGGSSGRTSRKKRTPERGERPRRESTGRPSCADCDGTAKCLHCKDGFYPLNSGKKAQCRKCEGSLVCHACRGQGIGGRSCGTPRYEVTAARVQSHLASLVRNSAILGQLGLAVIGADSSLASSALDQPLNAAGSMSDIVEVAQSEEERRRGRDVRGGTRDKGRRDRGSGRR